MFRTEVRDANLVGNEDERQITIVAKTENKARELN